MLIVNAKVYTMRASEVFDPGYVRFENGKILGVGPMCQAPAQGGEETLDADGGYVFPGFIDAHTHIGICAESINVAAEFVNEMTDPNTAQLRAIDGFFPFDTAIPKAREAGVTTALICPGSANAFGGQIAAVKLDGTRVEDMILKAPVAMKMATGDNVRTTYGPLNKLPMTRMGVAAVMREAFQQTQDYIARKERGEHPALNVRWEALAPVVKRELPIHVHAHRSDDIYTAMRVAREFGLELTVIHATDGAVTAADMAREHVNAIVGPTMYSSTKLETLNLNFKTPGIMARAGVKVALTTDHDVVPLAYLPICAALAVREGMDMYEALKAITINPAQIAHIDDRVGSLQAGKDADLSVFSGHPFELMTRARAVFVSGKRCL
ncbi:MAG TPA: amidohydrolase [Candidatus Pullichristensenella avicola]|nr:amidohydrolase [Candidatus Pullichristensenella avicola]